MFQRVTSLANRILLGSPPTSGLPTSLAGVGLRRLDGSPFPSSELAGRVLLFVNVASRCGHTPQYRQLVALQDRFGPRGLQVIGAPCNQFLGQEPGSAEQIATFCSTKYNVNFPILEKQAVNGTSRSPLYQLLIGSAVGGGSDVRWNFEKFLVGRDGTVRARFAPETLPDAAEVVSAVESALAEAHS